MQSRRLDVLSNTILFFVLTWISAGLRVYVRGVLRRNWGLDDTFMAVTLVSPTLKTLSPCVRFADQRKAIYTTYLASQFVSVKHGIGRHHSDLSEHDKRIALKVDLLFIVDKDTYSC